LRLRIEHIHSYTPYLEAVFSNRSLRTHHAVLTQDLAKVYSDVLIVLCRSVRPGTLRQ
jgi:hypothetical protein